jgi:hypothetical protein
VPSRMHQLDSLCTHHCPLQHYPIPQRTLDQSLHHLQQVCLAQACQYKLLGKAGGDAAQFLPFNWLHCF